MNRLRQPGDSDYDVLGVSPQATDEEINRAFRRLIDGEGYKVGVPLNRQWLRAHQIKAAHANLTDPAKRRAYDETLSRDSGPALWAAPANDPATDELVLSEPEPEAADPVEGPSTSEAAVSPESDEMPVASSEPDLVEDEELEPTIEDEVEPTHDEPPPYVAERTSAKRWGVAAAVASGLGLVVVASLADWSDQPPASQRTPSVGASEGQVRGAWAGFIQQFEGASSAVAPDSAEQRASSTDPAAPEEPGGDSEPRPAGDQTGSQGGKLAAADQVSITPTGTTPATAENAPPIQAAEAPAPPADAGAAAATAPENEEATAPLQRPPQWLGGGPTDADNRRGRYRGSVSVQVNVEPDGRVSSCAAVQGSGDAGLDALTCRLVRERARFAPALDTQGRPVESQAYTTFVWGRRERE